MKLSKCHKTSWLKKKKRIIFGFISICLPFLFLSLFEVGLQVMDYGGTTDLFIPAPTPYINYMKCNPAVAKRYFVRQSTIPQPANDIFLTRKPPNAYRIFVLGGSTALGFPYGNLLMFSRILHKRLQDTFPDKRIEVVNVALTAVNSYTLLDFMDEILEQDPDALLIYSGHNEYYGALGVASLEAIGLERWIALTYMKLNRLKLFRLVRGAIDKIARFSQGHPQKEEYNPYGTLMERLVTEQRIEYNSPLFNKGKVQFERNLKAIYEKAEEANVPIIISELVSNIQGMEPFVSLAVDGQPEAQQVYEAAQQSEFKLDYDLAKQDYYRAKDLDGLRFRAPELFNGIIHQVAAAHDSPVIPMRSLFERASPNGLIGNNLMVDHLHPNIDGNFLMADAFYETLRSNQILAERWDSLYILAANHYRATWPVTAIDTTIAALMIRHLKGGWPFSPKYAVNRTLIDFKPTSLVESLAHKVILNEMGLDEAHYFLARRYEKQNDIKLANKEYDALTHLIFIEAYSYLDRGQAFLRAEKYDEALKLLQESLKHEEIPLARRLISEIYLKMEDGEKERNYLEKINLKDDIRYN